MTIREVNPREDVADPPPEPDELPGMRRDLLAVGALTALTVFLWLMRRNGPAQLMEEGFMLALPQRVLNGAVQGRDFDYFYGPLSLWVPAIAYKVFGATLLVERAVRRRLPGPARRVALPGGSTLVVVDGSGNGRDRHLDRGAHDLGAAGHRGDRLPRARAGLRARASTDGRVRRGVSAWRAPPPAGCGPTSAVGDRAARGALAARRVRLIAWVAFAAVMCPTS